MAFNIFIQHKKITKLVILGNLKASLPESAILSAIDGRKIEGYWKLN